ncbi:maltose transport system permease protein MalF [mine drainage metagenome]|uniref:Maltose transport system permease protein MalF n=1 Tax=mine drainage metagenome TaxID=410659 RepID=A0A1J5S2Z6_9ZZZZ
MSPQDIQDTQRSDSPAGGMKTATPVHGRASGASPTWLLVTKWLLIGLTLAGLGVVAQKLIVQGSWIAVVIVAFVAMCILVVYGTARSVSMKYLLPGLVLLVGLQIWPIAFTVATSFTNYGDGHLYSKQASIDSIIADSVHEVPNTPRYKLSVAVRQGSDPATGEPFYLLTDPTGATFVGDRTGLRNLDAADVQKDGNGRITKATGYQILTAIQVNHRTDLNDFSVPTKDGGGIKRVGLSEAFEGKADVSYDKASDTLTDSATHKTYIPRGALWVPKDGQGDAFPQGWKENVGFKNFSDVLTNQTLRAGFLKIFAWNFVFAVVSVASTFLLGMMLALLLNTARLRGKALYRSLLILPYAIPGFVTALVWSSMFNQDYGLINKILHLNIDWLGDPWAAKAAILITNLWLGFPYMFIVCTGALQSIPGDVLEAAKIDGASAFRTMRSIIMPLLLVAVGPLLIASFAFNFNNFGLIFLLTGGGPFESANTSIGSSDLLITYAYRLAFSGVNPNYGLAATVSIFIFFIVGLMSYQGFRRTKALEDVN